MWHQNRTIVREGSQFNCMSIIVKSILICGLSEAFSTYHHDVLVCKCTSIQSAMPNEASALVHLALEPPEYMQYTHIHIQSHTDIYIYIYIAVIYIGTQYIQVQKSHIKLPTHTFLTSQGPFLQFYHQRFCKLLIGSQLYMQWTFYLAAFAKTQCKDV